MPVSARPVTAGRRPIFGTGLSVRIVGESYDRCVGGFGMRAWFLLLVAVCGTASAADEISFVNEGVVPAPIDEVWKVFATSEGYKALGPALAEVDLRVGGTIRSRYRADGTLGDAETIENVILAYEPPTMIATAHSEDAGDVPVQRSLEEAVDGYHADTRRRRADAHTRHESRLRLRRRVARDAPLLRAWQPTNHRDPSPSLRSTCAVAHRFLRSFITTTT